MKVRNHHYHLMGGERCKNFSQKFSKCQVLGLMLVVPGLATTRLVKDVRILVGNFLSVRIVQAMPRSAIACTRTPIHQIWS